jgi:single-strand DNA-binding protein
MNFNKVILIGRLTRDPENRALPSGQSLTSFGMATDRFFTDKNGQKQQQVEFHNIVLFGKLADTAYQYLNKGSLVLIEGRLQTRTWQDSSGNKRMRTEIVAERLQLGPKSAGKITPAAPPQEETEETKKEEIPIIEEDEIDIKDIPF